MLASRQDCRQCMHATFSFHYVIIIIIKLIINLFYEFLLFKRHCHFLQEMSMHGVD